MGKAKSWPLGQREKSCSESFLWGSEAAGTDQDLEAVSGGKVMSSASNDVLSLRPDKDKRKAGRLPAE